MYKRQADGCLKFEEVRCPLRGECREECVVCKPKLDTKLTARETEVFGCIGRGLQASDIADELCISIATVNRHRENLKAKLGLHSVGQLVPVSYTHLDVYKRQRIAWLERMLADKALSDEARAELQDERNELDLEQDERHLEERKAQIEQYKDMVTDIAGGMGEAMTQMFSGGEDAFKEALKQMLLTAVNAIHQYIVLAYIKTITDGILSGGVKLATGLAKIAAIEVAFAAVKGAINNFDSGGFTPSGRWDKPQGIVHSNEFVANRFAVANPHIRPVLDLIDHAQRTNSIGNLTGDDIAAVAGTSGFPSPAPASMPRTAQPTVSPAIPDMALIRMMAVVDKLSKKLDEPIYAYTTCLLYTSRCV